MGALIRSELTKLRTLRSNIALLTAGTLIQVLWAVGTSLTAGHGDLPPLGSPSSIGNLLRGGGVATWVVLVLGVMSMSGEHQHHTATSTFLATPVRHRVLAAKAAAMTVVGACYAAVNMVLALAAAIPVARSRHDHLQLANAHVARVAAGLVAATALYALLGVAIGAVVRHQTAAVAATILWFAMLENVVAIVARQHTARWLPGFAAQAAAGVGSSHLLPGLAAAGVLAADAALLAAVACAATLRRDV